MELNKEQVELVREAVVFKMGAIENHMKLMRENDVEGKLEPADFHADLKEVNALKEVLEVLK